MAKTKNSHKPHNKKPKTQFSKTLRSLYSNDPLHPVISALREAEMQRLDRLVEIVNSDYETVFQDSEEDSRALIIEIKQLATEWNEIINWLDKPRIKPLSFERAFEIANQMQSLNYSTEMIGSFMEKAKGKKAIGRPATKRYTTMYALEKRILEKGKWSYQKLARKFCDCEKQIHDHKCSEAIRQNIIVLKKILRKYCPDLTL